MTLTVREGLIIPERDLSFETSRSSGPGGQNVNKVETRVALLLDLDGTKSLSESQKNRIRQLLATRINKDGVLRVVSQKHRTQAANREATREKLADLLAKALKPRLARRDTKVPKRAKAVRREHKKRRSELKKSRRKVSRDS